MNKEAKQILRAVACLVLLLSMVAGIAPATDESEPSRPSFLTRSSEQAAKLSPLHQAMREILITEQKQLVVLYDEFARESDSQRALAIQQRIREVKIGAKISLLMVQAENARAEGRTKDAETLEEGIERLTHPEWFQASAPAPDRPRD